MKLIIEQKIWDYLDGNLDEKGRQEIERLIESNSEYRAVYEDLSDINNSLLKMDLEEPSLRFTGNIMDKLKNEPVPGSIKSLVDKRIIYGLLIFFLSAIAFLLAVLMFRLDWSTPTEGFDYSVNIAVKMPQVDPGRFDWVIKGFFFLDTVIVLYLFDYFLRRKMGTSARRGD